MIQPTRFRGQLLNACIGAVVFTVLGSLWAAFGVWSLGFKPQPLVVILLALPVVLLLISSVNAIRKVLRLPPDGLSSEMLELTRVMRRFGIINAAQGIAIGGVFMLGFRLRHPEYIPPVVAFVVGLHFFALAPILRMRFDYVIGLILCLLALVTMFMLPVYTNAGDLSQRTFLWGLVIGIGSAIALWLGAVSRLRGVYVAL